MVLNLLVVEISRPHTDTPHLLEAIRPSHKPLLDNTQHLQETDNHAPAGFEPVIPTSERP